MKLRLPLSKMQFMKKDEAKIGHILPLQTEKLLFEQKLLGPLLAGENVTAVWVEHGGRKKALSFLVQNADIFGFSKLGKYKLIYVDYNFLTEESIESYFKLILNSLGLPSDADLEKFSAFFCLKTEIERILAQSYRLIFILSGFESINFPSSFFNNLKALWQLDKKKIHFIFGVAKNIFAPDNFGEYDHLREVLTQNVVYFPIFEETEAEFVYEYLLKKYSHRIEPKNKKLILDFGGGHPALIRACQRSFNEHPQIAPKESLNFLAKRFEVKIILEDIWHGFDKEEKDYLKKLAKERAWREIAPERLLKLRVVISEKGKNKLFSELMTDFILKQKEEISKLSLDEATEEILINGQAAKEGFSLKVYDLLVFFLKNKGRVVSRDELGNVLWGDEAYNKYSDWAIDQLISQLRKKIDSIGAKGKSLKTVRGRGYRFID